MIIGTLIIMIVVTYFIGYVIGTRKTTKDILKKLEELEGESPEEEMAIAKIAKMFYNMFVKGDEKI